MKQFLQDSQAALSDKKHRASRERESIKIISFVNISQIIKADQTPALMLHKFLLPLSSASDAAMLQLQFCFGKCGRWPFNCLYLQFPSYNAHHCSASICTAQCCGSDPLLTCCQSCGTAPAISKIAHTVTTKVHSNITDH
jgi:hypothetical protein